MASGGVCVLHPFAVVYGSNGLIKNSNANDISAAGWTPGGGSFANEANVAGTKFIHGAPVRGGGQSPAGLFWGLDTLVRMSFVGGTTLWSYDTISKPTSIMSKKCVVECDGKFFWIGTDRFLMYNGVVQEIANPMNSDYFFNSINYAQRNKVWGTKVTRWGEIWWFYPRGDATECNAAIIYNYRENTWYDAAKARSAGGHVQTFRFPVWSGPEDVKVTTSIPVGQTLVLSAATASGSPTLTFLSTAGIAVGRPISGFGIPAGTTVTAFTSTTITMSANSTAVMPIGTQVAVTAMTKGFIPGETLTGSGGATGRVVRASPFAINVDNFVGTFAAGDTLTGSFGGTATATATPFAQTLETLYQHEVGKDKVVGTAVSAINSSVTSRDFGFANANPISDATNTHDLMTRVLRLDPDYAQVGDLTVEVLGKSFTKDPYRVLSTNVIHPNTAFLDIRDSQERILRIRVTSNSQGGDFQQGRVAIGIEPGDERSTITT